MAQQAQAAAPEVIVIATPHGLRAEGAIVLAMVARGYGILHHKGRTIESNVPVDLRLTAAIAASAQARGIPTLRAGFGGNSVPESRVPLDWGTLVPAWFLGHDRNLIGYGDMLVDPPQVDIGPPIVIVTPSRDLPRNMLVEFGGAVAEAASADGRRVAFVASCDWAHTHVGGRYGESDAAAEVDGAVVAAIRDNDPGRLIDLDPARVEAAAIDGLWQALILAGVLRETPMQGKVLSYEAPPNYATGMIVATLTLCQCQWKLGREMHPFLDEFRTFLLRESEILRASGEMSNILTHQKEQARSDTGMGGHRMTLSQFDRS